MKVHFMGIEIISLLNPKDKSHILEGQENYKTYSNKEVASIYTKINDNCIELIPDCFDTATIISKFRSQFTDKGCGVESMVYHNLHQISVIDCIDMPDYVSKL